MKHLVVVKSGSYEGLWHAFYLTHVAPYPRLYLCGMPWLAVLATERFLPCRLMRDFLTWDVLRLLKCVRRSGTHCQCLCHTSRSASPCRTCALGVCRRFLLHYNSRCIQCYWKTNENAGQQGFIFLLRILSGCSVMSHLILLMLLIFFLIVIFIFRLLIHFIH